MKAVVPILVATTILGCAAAIIFGVYRRDPGAPVVATPPELDSSARIETPTYLHQGRVTDATGSPAKGVEVRLAGDGGEPAAITDADGRFGLDVAADQAPLVELRGPGVLPARARLEPDESTSVVVYPGGRLVGRIRDTHGGAIEDARFEAFGAEGLPLEVRQGPDGTFELDGPAGVVVLTLRSSTHADGLFPDVVLTVGKTTEREFVLEDGVSLELGIAASGRAIPDARVRVWTGGGDRDETTSDSRGKATLTGLHPGRATVLITRPGLTEHIEVLDLTAEPALRRHPIVLERTRPWMLDVLDPQERPLRQATVEIRRQGRLIVATSPGSPELQLLAPGREYELRARTDHFPWVSVTWTFPQERLAQLRIDLAPGGWIEGVVEDAGEQPLPAARIEISPLPRAGEAAPPGFPLLLEPDLGGRFRSPALHRGGYRVRALHAALGRREVEIEVEVGVTGEARITY